MVVIFDNQTYVQKYPFSLSMNFDVSNEKEDFYKKTIKANFILNS